MQTWGEVKELQNLRNALMKEYRADSTVVKILVYELAFYTWEIHELMKVRFDLTRRKYAGAIEDMLKSSGAVIDDTVIGGFLRREQSHSKLIDEYIKSMPVETGEVIVTSMSHYKKQFDMIDVMLSAAERRRGQLLKELDRFEMARILISERKPR